MERTVKGIWIPIEIWEAEDLTMTEKVMLMEIDSFTRGDKGCYAGNAHFATMLDISKRQVMKLLADMEQKGYITIVRKGKRRYVLSAPGKVNKSSPQGELEFTVERTGVHPYNINEYIKVDKSTLKEINKEMPVRFDFKRSLEEIGVTTEVAEAWMQVRKEKKAVNTEIAFRRIRDEIAKSGRTADDCIRTAVEKSWRGFEASWLDNIDAEGKGKKDCAERKVKESSFEKSMKSVDQMFGTNYHESLYGKK